MVYDPPHTFTHTYRAQRSDGTYWPADTVVTVSLSAVGTRTRVVVEHSGFERLPVEYAQRAFEAWTGGWAVAFGRLPRTASAGVPAVEPLIIRRQIEIDAPPERVWPYVGTAAGYARWSCPPAHTHDVILEPKVGGRFEGRMVVGGREYRSVGEIVAYQPPHRLAVKERSAAGDVPDARHTSTFTITLTELAGRRTRVTVEHTGFESLPAALRRDAYDSFDQGWAHAIEELRIVVAHEPFPAPGTQAAIRRHLIRKEIDIATPVDRVWGFVGTQAGSAQWHRAENVPGTLEYEDEVLEEYVGGRYELRGLYGGQAVRISGRVLAYDPPQLLVLSWREDGWPAETRVTFRLWKHDGQTRVRVLHTGFERLPEAIRDRALGEYEERRQRGMATLKALAEGNQP